MRGPLYLAWCYLLHHRVKTAILVSSIALILFLPGGLRVLVEQSADQLVARAGSTPLLIGAKGSALELVLNSLYFESKEPESSRYAEAMRIEGSGFAHAIPMLVRFEAAGHPIVGTSLEYFDFRGLRIGEGRPMAVLGECVLGAAAARDLGLGPGDSLVSSPESVFDLAGSYPLKMRISGVLEPAHTPDDQAVFVDIKTSWIIQGLGHGHQDLAAPAAESAVLSKDGGRIVANASLVEYNEIKPENIDSFHFHGDIDDHPVSAIIALPLDDKSRVLLMGRYEGKDERVQILRPLAVMDELLDTVLTIQDYAVAAMAVVASATLATAALVFMLSLKLRRREIETLNKIGGTRVSVALVMFGEVVFVLMLGSATAGLLTLATSRFGSAAIRAFLLS